MRFFYTYFKLYLLIIPTLFLISCNTKKQKNNSNNNNTTNMINYNVLPNYKELINYEKLSKNKEHLLNNIHIAILDDATDITDPYLQNKFLNHNLVYWDKINDFIPARNNEIDSHGHAVSRIIAGDLDELSGLEGVSPKAKIAFYSATPDSIIPNLQHSVRQSKLENAINIRLANISFSEVNMGHLNSGEGDFRDIVIVAAAGNDESGAHQNTFLTEYKAFNNIPLYNNILVAVAVNSNSQLTSVSKSCGETKNFCVAVPVSDYTGKAAAILSGILANLMAEEPEHLTADYVNAILATASNRNNPNNSIGMGLINFNQAKLYLRNQIPKISNNVDSIKYWVTKLPHYRKISNEELDIEKVLVNSQYENVYKVKVNGITKSVIKVTDNNNGCKEFLTDWNKEYISFSSEIKNMLPNISFVSEFSQTNSLCLLEFKTIKNSALFDDNHITKNELLNSKLEFLNKNYESLNEIKLTNLKNNELAYYKNSILCPTPRISKYDYAIGGYEAYCLKIENSFKYNLPDIIKQKIYENKVNDLEIFFLAQSNSHEFLKYLGDDLGYNMSPVLDVFRAHFWVNKNPTPTTYSDNTYLMMVHSNQPDIYKFELFKEAAGHLQEDLLLPFNVFHHDGILSPDNTHTGLSHLNDRNFSFYSLIIDPQLKKAIVTLHWLVNNNTFSDDHFENPNFATSSLQSVNKKITNKGYFTISEILFNLSTEVYENIHPQLKSLNKLLEIN